MDSIVIYFIRHGEVSNPNKIIYGRTDIPLNKKGFQQIENLAVKLKNCGVKPDVIYSSVQKRTIQSARRISEIFDGVKIIQESALQEVYAPELQGKPLELAQGIDIYDSEKTKDFPIEKPEVISERVLSVIRRIVKEHTYKTVFIVGHGDPFAFAIWRLLHPKGNLPSIVTLSEDAYLGKGTAWRVVMNAEGKVFENEIIG